MKLLGEVLKLGAQYLQEKGVASSRLTAELLLAHLLEKKRVDLYMQFDCPLEEPELAQFRMLLKRASTGEPVEYITGEVEFFGCRLRITKEVLIPRQETEILADKIAKSLALGETEGKVLWDVCAGSGCLGLSLKKKFPALQVTLSDISVEALKICLYNAQKNQLHVSCVQGDLLAPFIGREKAHVVVCNPPYVSESEYVALDCSVKDYEPRRALVGGADGLEFYKRLAKELPPLLHPRAQVFLELGTGQGEKVKEIFSSPIWKQKEVFLDFAGHDRFFFLEIE